MAVTKATLNTGKTTIQNLEENKEESKIDDTHIKILGDEHSLTNIELSTRPKQKVKLKNLKATPKTKKSKSPRASKAKSPKSPTTGKDSKPKKSPKESASPTKKKTKTQKIPDFNMDEPAHSPSGRRKRAKPKKQKGIFDEFRKRIKTKAQGEKTLKEKSPSKAQQELLMRNAIDGDIQLEEDIEEAKEGNKIDDLERGGANEVLETEDRLFTSHDNDQLDTERNLAQDSSQANFDSESDSDIENAPRVKNRLEEEEDIRNLDNKNYPNVLEDIQEHTLFLLRAIFDAFDDQGDKITKYFRKNRFSKALQIKSVNLLDCPEELLREFQESDSNILDPNQLGDYDDENNKTLLEGMNQDLSMLNGSEEEGSRYAGQDGLDIWGANGRKGIDKFGNLEEYSVDTGETPCGIQDQSIGFLAVDEGDKPSNLDSESFDASGKNVVVYDKEDLTNFSKHLGLNQVKLRPLPQFEGLYSSPVTPKNISKKPKNKSLDKLNQLSGIYGSEPANSIINRSKAFGLPIPLSLRDNLKKDKGRVHSYEGRDDNVNFGKSLFDKDPKSLSPKGRRKKLTEEEKAARKLRKRTKKLEKQALEDKKKKFRALDLNAKALKEKANLAKKKARKRIAGRAIDYTFFLDYESPYAEYLPARYREWQPKEPKKPENNFVQPGLGPIGEKLDEVSMIYKQEREPHSANMSRIKGRDKPHKNKSSSNLGGESAFSFAKNLHPNHRKISSKFHKNRKSISQEKSVKKPGLRQPIILDEFDDSIQLESEDGLQVFKPKKESREESKHQVNTSLIQSERGPHLIPSGMDIEENSDGESLRPLFKSKMPHKINPVSEPKSRPSSKASVQETPGLITFGALNNVGKESELSSQGVEVIQPARRNAALRPEEEQDEKKESSKFLSVDCK